MSGEGFGGFATECFEFLDQLGRSDKSWFDHNRGDYTRHVVTPTKAFVVALGERLADGFAPGITAQPKTNGSMAPINNDLRFSPEANPYKDHLLLRFWEGDTKKTAPTLMVRLSPHMIGFATGAVIDPIDEWRRLIDDPATGAALADALADLAIGRELDIDGQGYKRVPKPYHEDHPRAELLKHKGVIQARWTEELPAAVGGEEFVDYCYQRLEACAPVHRWLVTNRP